MSFQDLRDANQRRHIEWAKGGAVSLSFRGVELGGEAGEVLNEIKKIERERFGLVGSKEIDTSDIANELADVLICVDLIAMDLGIDLQSAVRTKFNRTSEKYGLTTRFEV
ncbi:MAG: MazG-like family protein [Planctomycetota bacterium]